MATTVTQDYTPSLNVSVTVKDGVVTKVTKWVTGSDATRTERVEYPTAKR